MSEQQGGPDFAEKVEGGDAGHQVGGAGAGARTCSCCENNVCQTVSLHNQNSWHSTGATL